ncbi:amidohydrolase family protein [Roseburia hominis]
MERIKLDYARDILAGVKDDKLVDPVAQMYKSGRTIIKNGTVVDPKNGIHAQRDIAYIGDTIVETADEIKPERGDRIIDCEGLLVFPGLIDMHLHMHDLFEVTTNSIYHAAEDGVTTGFTPGAGNTLIGPALLGAEIDRGLPVNVGMYLGAASLLSTQMSTEDWISYFKGTLPAEVAFEKATLNFFANTCGNLIMGIKDHMGHFLLSDEDLDAVYEITSKAGLVFMSHTQDPFRAEHVVGISKGRPVHLGHVDIAGCGTHGDAVESMKMVLDLCKQPNVSGEVISTLMRIGKGSREALFIPKESQRLLYDAIHDGLIRVMISDGDNDGTIKGGGDTRDNIPAILELAQQEVVTLPQAVALMTSNVAELLAERCHNPYFTEKLGHLGVGASANITIVDEADKMATYTIVNGAISGFENRVVRKNVGCGKWISRIGSLENMGVGELPMFYYWK